MRNRRLHRKILHLREVARRRKLTSGERAILKFAEAYTATEDVVSAFVLPKSPHSASEDEDEKVIRSCSACERETDDEAAKFCASCGKRLSDVEDDSERRTDEDEGRSGGLRPRDDVNSLGDDQPRYHGQSTAKHSERVGADEAVKTFRSQYRKAREAASFSADSASAAIVRTGF